MFSHYNLATIVSASGIIPKVILPMAPADIPTHSCQICSEFSIQITGAPENGGFAHFELPVAEVAKGAWGECSFCTKLFSMKWFILREVGVPILLESSSVLGGETKCSLFLQTRLYRAFVYLLDSFKLPQPPFALRLGVIGTLHELHAGSVSLDQYRLVAEFNHGFVSQDLLAIASFALVSGVNDTVEAWAGEEVVQYLDNSDLDPVRQNSDYHFESVFGRMPVFEVLAGAGE
jgi:hypothetical protein